MSDPRRFARVAGPFAIAIGVLLAVERVSLPSAFSSQAFALSPQPYNIPENNMNPPATAWRPAAVRPVVVP